MESSDSSSSTDSTFVSELFTFLGANIVPSKTFRLGKLLNKPRPIKTVFSSSSDVFSVLKLKQKLRDITKLRLGLD